MQSLISIIIPCYNDWQYVEQAVNSALNQTYVNKEVIVVDDGSNAKTKEVLKRLEPKITKLITQENQGQSKARNVGIKASKGNYILVLDSDDYFELTFCEKAILFFLNDDEVKIVSCFANLLLEDGTSSVYKTQGGEISDFLGANNALGTSLFKKSDWVNSGGYDESMRKGFEDWEFFIRLLKNGGYTKVIQEPLYNYRKKNNSTTTIANSKKYELLEYIYLKHQELYKIHFHSFVTFMLSRIEREETEKLKNLRRIEYRIGMTILKPFRIIKSLLK
ncbi:glycosyltransferase family A protein [Flavobacterium sp. WC2509]|uniref:glycosyltransferase family A protein n=1 Tax=Flavobacterium sp. WC2509 TaxID=3461406 RepID=UPI004044BBF7